MVALISRKFRAAFTVYVLIIRANPLRWQERPRKQPRVEMPSETTLPHYADESGWIAVPFRLSRLKLSRLVK